MMMRHISLQLPVRKNTSALNVSVKTCLHRLRFLLLSLVPLYAAFILIPVRSLTFSQVPAVQESACPVQDDHLLRKKV